MTIAYIVLAAVVAAAGAAPDSVVRRRAQSAAMASRDGAAILSGLRDRDPMIRRQALFALYLTKPAQAADEARRMLGDDSRAVRIVAKSICRAGGQWRDNNPRSLDAANDHDTVRVFTVRPKGGRFSLNGVDDGGKAQAVELWFGKPREDLRVWINGVYLGQFDADASSGREFRLDATAEVRRRSENEVVARNAAGDTVAAPFTVEGLRW